MEDEFDLLAGVLLEGGDDLPDRLVLLGVEPLLPPHHEIGGPCAERCGHEQSGKYRADHLDHGKSPSAVDARQITP